MRGDGTGWNAYAAHVDRANDALLSYRVIEQTTPLLAVLEPDGTLKQRIDVVAGARQNQLRSLAARNSNWLVGGMVNGPGTHTADGNPARIVADGFVHETIIFMP